MDLSVRRRTHWHDLRATRKEGQREKSEEDEDAVVNHH